MVVNRRSEDRVTASEVASWGWCPESWRLGTQGWEPTNVAARAQGEDRHRQTAAIERSTQVGSTLGVALLVVAMVVAVGLILLGARL